MRLSSTPALRGARVAVGREHRAVRAAVAGDEEVVEARRDGDERGLDIVEGRGPDAGRPVSARAVGDGEVRAVRRRAGGELGAARGDAPPRWPPRRAGGAKRCCALVSATTIAAYFLYPSSSTACFFQ